MAPGLQRGIKPHVEQATATNDNSTQISPESHQPPRCHSVSNPSDPAVSPSLPQTSTSADTIVPQENPVNFLDPSLPSQDGDNLYSGLMEDGLGGDELPDDDEEEFEDDDAQTKKRRRYNPPTWLMNQFNQKLEECRRRDAQGLPALYRDNCTFWFPIPSPFFLLRGSSISPEGLMIARFFLWDPEVLCSGISCPNCSSRLVRHGHACFPRRCVDLTGRFWIIGFEYRCRWCAEESKKGKKIQSTFLSWDERILRSLPHSLAAEFPAHLTHRSGLSKEVFMLLRSCFQNGLGAKQFADTLRVLHLQAYDELHLQYLHALAVRKGMSQWRGEKYEDFLPFTDHSQNGPHGFVPCSQWFRDLYDKEIEKHQDELNQCIAMCSGEIYAIDHSHKVSLTISMNLIEQRLIKSI